MWGDGGGTVLEYEVEEEDGEAGDDDGIRKMLANAVEAAVEQ